jgi:hypothetical protein
MSRKEFFAPGCAAASFRPRSGVRVSDAVPGVANRTGRARTRFRGALTGTYLIAAVVGFVLGGRELLPFGHFPGTSTPLTRVGFALWQDNLQTTPEAWSALSADVDVVRSEFAGQTHEPERDQARDVFDLVVAVGGLKSAGNSDWNQAERLCRALKWPRCDRPALEELKARSRP